MSVYRRIATTLLFTLSTAGAAARADTMITPFAGVNFGGESGKEFGDALDANRFNWGVSFAFMGAGVFGVEGDYGYSPDFFGKTDLGGSSVSTLTGNFLLGVPFGGQQGFGVRPYGLIGVGVVHPSGDAFDNVFDFGESKFGWDVGGGLMMFFANHVGIRADLRYFRTFEAVDLIGDEPGDLDFARGSIGLVLRF